MKAICPAVAVLLIWSLAPLPLAAKGRTAKITIQGADLKSPIEITDPKVEQFHVWAGPGVYVNGVEETEGFIIDWQKGIGARPSAELRRYNVSFYSGCRTDEKGCRQSEPSLIYVVSYAYDAFAEQGYVYLPGPSDQLFRSNRAMWHGHGFEGNWLRAARACDKFAAPFILKARR